jgi:hypothetical protein
VPEVQQLEIFAQAARQAIQAAIGFSNPQVQRNRTAPISGKALEEFEQQGDIKTFHFVDNFDRALEHEGRILMDLIPVVYDSEREVAIIGNDDKSKVVTLNAPPGTNGKEWRMQPHLGQPPIEFPTDQGEHDYTVSTGPSYESQRAESNKFSDLVVSNPQLVTLALQNPQSTSAKLLGMAIRLKDLGPMADAMADILDPPEQGQQPIPPQVLQAVQQMKQQFEQATAMVGELQQQLKERVQEKQMELEMKRIIAADRNRTDLIIAQLKLGADAASDRLNADMQAIEHQAAMLHESELAPGPDQGPQGIHPSAIPQPEAGGEAQA